jgi:hypothetical protein
MSEIKILGWIKEQYEMDFTEELEQLEPRDKSIYEKVVQALTEKLEREWIPVSERLPEEYEQSSDIYDMDTLAVIDTKHFTASDLMVVTVKDIDKDILFVCDDITVDGKWVNFSDGFEVIAWQPLPEPYKEVTK